MLPRHVDKQWGLGEVCLKSANEGQIDQRTGKSTIWCTGAAGAPWKLAATGLVMKYPG
jgi:hypothetical protein